MIVDCKVIQYHLNVCYVKNCSRIKNDPFRTNSSHLFGKLHVYLLQKFVDLVSVTVSAEIIGQLEFRSFQC